MSSLLDQANASSESDQAKNDAGDAGQVDGKVEEQGASDNLDSSDGEGKVFSQKDFESLAANEDFIKDGKLFGVWNDPDEMIKGVKELRGKVREKNPEAPEKYDFSSIKIEGSDLAIDEEGELFKAMSPVMKEIGLSQEQAAKLAQTFLGYEASSVVDFESEKTKLGDNWQKVINDVKVHVRDKAPEDLHGVIDEVTQTAEGVRLLSWLAEGKLEGSVPTGGAPVSTKSAQELLDEAMTYRDSNIDDMNNGNQEKQNIYREKMKAYATARLKETGK